MLDYDIKGMGNCREGRFLFGTFWDHAMQT
jgi:hypothetical protein